MKSRGNMTTNFKQVAIDSLVPYAKNSRNHPPGQIDQIAASIKEFGFLSPCVISADNTIIAGHGRVMAAKKLGIETVPCVVADHLTDAQRRAYVLIDNRLTDTSEWDKEMLKIELADLTVSFPELDLPVMGFSPEEIEALGLDTIDAEVVGLTDEDAVPEAPKTPTTKTGDIWLLGNHRVMCGDSTDAGSVALLMGGDKADLWLTDPPYGVSYQGKTKDALEIENDNMPLDEMSEFWTAIAESALAATTDRAPYYWFACQGGDQMMMMMSINRAKWKVRHELIWVKDSLVLSRCDYHYQHEPILYGWKQDGVHDFFGDRSQTSVLEFARPKRNDVHPTMKPVELLERLINNSSKTKGKVLDTCLGSGSTLIACEKTSRRCFGMEIDPQYVDVIVKRWEQFTGRLATLEGDGRTFEEVQRERVG